jgi:predicted secreted protein
MRLAALLASLAVVHLGAGANGKTVRVRVGGDVVLRLPANASTGYAWTFRARGAPVPRLLGSRYAPGASGLIGAPGSFVARFAVRGRGRAAVSLVYARDTHPATPPARRFRVTILAR